MKNEMALVSARKFSVEETNLYAGSRGEPARMATNFAGVQGSDDSRNDIVVRGNTPISRSKVETFSINASMVSVKSSPVFTPDERRYSHHPCRHELQP